MKIYHDLADNSDFYHSLEMQIYGQSFILDMSQGWLGHIDIYVCMIRKLQVANDNRLF